MARNLLGVIAIAVLGMSATYLRAGDTALTKELERLNALTGSQAPLVMAKTIVANKEHAKKLLGFGLPAAKDKQLSYNGALTLGLVAAELKDMKTAEVYFRVCMDRAAKLQSPGQFSQSYGLLIKYYYDGKNYSNAARLCKELLELNTNDEVYRLVIGTRVDSSGEVDFGEPQEGFTPTQALRPTIYTTYVKATAKDGNIDKALKLVESLLKKKTNWLDHELKGWVLLEAGRLEDAAQGYESVLEQIAKDKRLKQPQKAIYTERFRHLLSGLYFDLKQIDKATEIFQALIKSRPNEANYYNDLGFYWADHNLKLNEAEKLVEKALALDRDQRKQRKTPAAEDRDNGNYLDSLAWVYYRQKKFKEAKELLLKALEDKNAQTLETFDHLGDTYLALGEIPAAVQTWQKGLEHVNDTRRDGQRKILVEKKLKQVSSSK